MTQHVREYLLQQLTDIMLMNLLISATFFSGVSGRAYGLSKVMWAWQLTVFIGIAIVGIWRPRPDPVDFDWSQTADWLYLWRETGAATLRQNMSGLKWFLVGSGLAIVTLSSQHFDAPQSWQYGVSRTLVAIDLGIMLGNLLLWSWRRLRQRA